MMTINRYHIAAAMVLLSSLSIRAQVGIGTNSPTSKLEVVGAGSTSATSALKVSNSSGSPILTVRNDGLVQISTTTNGFLPPRMTYAQRNSIISPEAGLIIYCSNCGAGQPQYYNGTAWVNLIGETAWSQPPTVSGTSTISAITKSSATGGGNVTNDFGNTVTVKGICWSITPNPTTANWKTAESGGTGNFSSALTGLSPNVTYYVRAYATNAAGTGYGPEISFRTVDFDIGESRFGGRIAYILQPGDPGFDGAVTHGLVVSTSDQSTGATWYNGSNVTTGAAGTAIGTGLSNSNTIITGQGNTNAYAAKLCRDYTAGGYTDWFLPSANELEKWWSNRGASNAVWSNGYYWTSTETSTNEAKSVSFITSSSGIAFASQKSSSYYVRAMRAF